MQSQTPDLPGKEARHVTSVGIDFALRLAKLCGLFEAAKGALFRSSVLSPFPSYSGYYLSKIAPLSALRTRGQPHPLLDLIW